MDELESQILPGNSKVGDEDTCLWKIHNVIVAASVHVTRDTGAVEREVLEHFPGTTFGEWRQYENPGLELGLIYAPGVHGPALISLCNGYEPPFPLPERP